MLEQTINSLDRDIQLVDNKAREEAIFRVYEQGVDGGTESDATAAAEAAINDAYATVEKSILQSYMVRYHRAYTVTTLFTEETGNWAYDHERAITYNVDTNEMSSVDWTRSATMPATDVDHELYDGSLITVPTVTPSDHTPNITPFDTGQDSAVVVAKPDPADYSSVTEGDVTVPEGDPVVFMLKSNRWANLLSDLDTQHTNMMSEVSSIVSTYFSAAQDGDIQLDQMMGPKHLTDTASSAKDYQEAAMALRGMGYPLSEQVVTIELPTKDGGSQEFVGRLSWTAHQGNTLVVGQTHFAENLPGSIFAAVNLPDGVDSVSGNTTNTTNTTNDGDTSTGPGAEIVELTDEFTIISAEGADAVSFKDRSLATSDTTPEEVEQTFKENYEANKEATENVHDTATGGGGGLSWSAFSTTEKAIALGAAGLGAFGLLNN